MTALPARRQLPSRAFVRRFLLACALCWALTLLALWATLP